MKKSTLIILIIIISLTAKAQHFGVNVDAGMSRISTVYTASSNIKNKSKLYYGIGIFYAKLPSTSKWGFKTSIDFNKRGTGTSYEGPSGFRFSPADPVYFVSSNTLSTRSLALTFLLTLNSSKNFQFFLGPHMGYILGNTNKGEVTEYVSSAKKIEISSFSNEDNYNADAFSERLHYGGKAGFNVKITDHFDLGLTYQYARLLKYATPHHRPFYNILSLSTSFYLKSRKEAE
jgi:hypothetical protein